MGESGIYVPHMGHEETIVVVGGGKKKKTEKVFF